MHLSTIFRGPALNFAALAPTTFRRAALDLAVLAPTVQPYPPQQSWSELAEDQIDPSQIDSEWPLRQRPVLVACWEQDTEPTLEVGGETFHVGLFRMRWRLVAPEANGSEADYCAI
jgi:hypothetical protein